MENSKPILIQLFQNKNTKYKIDSLIVHILHIQLRREVTNMNYQKPYFIGKGQVPGKNGDIPKIY